MGRLGLVKLRAVIGSDGDLTAVYHDFFGQINLGPLSVVRESEVEFNATEQIWEARDSFGKLIASDRNRDKCLELEKEVIERRLLGMTIVRQ